MVGGGDDDDDDDGRKERNKNDDRFAPTALTPSTVITIMTVLASNKRAAKYWISSVHIVG